MVLQVHWAERSLSATNAKTQLVCLLRFEVSEQTDRLGILTHGGMVKTIIAIYRVGNLVMEKLAGHKTTRSV